MCICYRVGNSAVSSMLSAAVGRFSTNFDLKLVSYLDKKNQIEI